MVMIPRQDVGRLTVESKSAGVTGANIAQWSV
jgi:hypothetical protein